MQTSRLIRVAVVAVAACSGCKVLDDDEPILTAGGGTGDYGERSCKEAVQEIKDCEYPFQWWFDSDGGSGKLVLIDDPAATVGVGPNAWLVMISSEADYIGTHDYDGGDCHAHCGWCEAGQYMCHGGLTEDLVPRGCVMCFPYGLPDVGEQCAALQAVCLEGGTEGDEGLDETGADTDAIGEYDCTTWRPQEGVRRDRSTITIDAALVEEVFLYQGEPVAVCDEARFRRRSDGHFEVSRLVSHGLLPEMGLATGDVILAVDGVPLNNLDSVMQAASVLADAARFTVTIARGDERFDMNVIVR